MTRHRQPGAIGARLLVGLIVAASGLFAIATMVGFPATPGARAATTATTTYAPTPTTGPTTTAEPTTTVPVTTTVAHPLASTGADVEIVIAIAAAAIAIGGLVVLSVRRQRRTTVP